MEQNKLDNEYWSNRYLNNEAQWDMGMVSPPIKTYIDQLTDKNITILIPGCGNAYEAEYLLEQGFTSVTLIDISDVIASQLRKKFSGNKNISIITGDFFELKGSFDLVIEQTFFCALDPSLRKAYVNKMHELIKPGGKLAGVLFDREFEESPPFGGNIDEYRELFTGLFKIHVLDACYNSIPKRRGAEVFLIALRKD